LKTDFSALGLGYALYQPDDTPKALAAMRREDEGGKCESDKCQRKLRLKPCGFGARKTIGNEKHFHTPPGECTAATWSITKNRHYLWGRPFSLISDCEALMWLLNDKGHNHAVISLQLELLGYWFTIVSRAGDLMEDANYFSRLGKDIHSDPLMTDYLSFQRQLYDDNAPAKDELNDQNTPGRRSKKTRIVEEVDQTNTPDRATINFANVNWHAHTPVDITPEHEVNRQLLNLPIQFTETGILQSKSHLNSSFMATTTQLIHKFTWCIHQPDHSHFLEQSREWLYHIAWL
jgi:hypothetical protein